MTAEGFASVAEDLLSRLSGSPDAYPQQIDLVRDMVLLILFDQAQYRSASFLDDRILGPATKGAWVPVASAAAASRTVSNARPVHFIFHTGHVGSTLVSRLLDETGEVLSLREPLPLRTLADAYDALGRPDSLLSASQFEFIRGMFMRLWSRGYATTRCVAVKATSSASRLAVPILTSSEGVRGVYLSLRAEPYLATLLAGQNSPIDLRGHGSERMRRLQAHGAAPLPPLHTLSIGELAAMSWLAETCTQRDAMTRFADRVMSLDFDQFLSTITESMARILSQFGLPHDAGYLSSVGRSPVLSRYSKGPEYAYSPSVRAKVLSASRRDNREEIRRGMDWLERRAQSDGTLAAIVNAANAWMVTR